MTRAMRLALVRAAVVTGLATGLALGASGLPQRHLRPDAGGAGAPPGTTSHLLASAEIACPGAEFAGVPDVADLPVQPELIAATAPADAVDARLRLPAQGRLALQAGSAASLPESASGTSTQRGSTVRGDAVGAAPWLVSAVDGLAPGLLAGQESDVAVKEKAAGLASTACTAPAAEAWLTGGGGEAGRQERLVLTNSGANPVTVDVTAYGAGGPIVSDAARGIVVEGRSRRAVLLDALAPREASPVFHLTTRGGFVSALLADSWLEGITPRGLESVAPLAAPDTEQVLSGLPGGLPGRVRIVVPGEKQAVVEVRVLSNSGPRARPGARGVSRIPAGHVLEVDLGTLPAGVSGLQIRSDEPVTAAAVIGPPDGRDFGWAPAADALTGVAGAVYPALRDTEVRTRTLSLVASGGPARVSVTTLGARGAVATREVTLAADTGSAVDLSASQGVWVRLLQGAGRVHAAMLVVGPDGKDFALATRALTPARITAAEVDVRPAG